MAQVFLDKSLTNARRVGRVVYMEDALSILVSQALDGRPVREAAEVCEIADYLIRDILYKKTRRPAPETLRAIARLGNVTYEQLALAAYGIIREPVLT